MSELFLVTFLSCFIAVVVFWNAMKLWGSITSWLMMRRMRGVQYEGMQAPGSAIAMPLSELLEREDYSESIKRHNAREDLQLAVLDLKTDVVDPEIEKRILETAKAYRACVNEKCEARIRAMATLRRTGGLVGRD